MRMLALLPIVVVALSSYADSILVDGKRFDDVYVTESKLSYIICFPLDGTMKTVSKDKVKEGDLVLTKDVDTRSELFKAWEVAASLKRVFDENERKEKERQIKQQALEQEQREREKAEAITMRKVEAAREEAIRNYQKDLQESERPADKLLRLKTTQGNTSGSSQAPSESSTYDGSSSPPGAAKADRVQPPIKQAP